MIETTVIETDPEVGMLADTARAFLTGFVDNAYLNEQEVSVSGFESVRWKQLCDLGWTAAGLPERVGGSGGGLAASAALAAECGRAAFASPWLASMRAAAVLETVGSAADTALTAVAAGTPHALFAPPDFGVRAEPAQGGYRLRGPATQVEWLDAAEEVALLVPRADGGWLCAILPRDRFDGRVAETTSVDNERSARVEPDGLRLPADAVVADDIVDAAARRALARANLLRAAVMVGGCDAVVEFTARYARERVQFDQPIGRFQAVRHHLARMAIATDAARLTRDEALWELRSADGGAATGAVAVFVAGRSYVEVVLTAAQVHGGVGTTVEHVLHHHFRRAKAMQLRSGKRAVRLRELADVLVRDRPDTLW
jgi:alkylation response protein AidB-like acyl-CoA dehydrogenase